MTENGLKHILNRSLKIMEFDIADPPPNYGIFHFFFLMKASLTGAVEYDFVHLVTAWPRPNIPVLKQSLKLAFFCSES